MKTRACASALLVVLASSFLPLSPARAEEKDTVTEMARQRFQEGVKFFDQKKYEEARAAFLQAYALKHHPAVLLNLAQSELRSSHPTDAAKHFSAFLRDSSTASSIERGEAERGLTEARTKLGRLHITVNLSGADISVDGDSVGQSPLADPVDVSPGSHSVEAKYGARSAASNVNAPAGKVINVPLTLEGSGAGAAAAAAPPAAGAAAPAASPPASEDAAPASGASSETASKADSEPQPESSDTGIKVSSGGREPFLPWLVRSPIGIAGIALTLGGAGFAVAFKLSSQSASDSASTLASKIKAAANGQLSGIPPAGDRQGNPCAAPVFDPADYSAPCSELRDNLDRQNTDNTLATVGAVAAGVGVGVVVVGYFLTARKEDASTVASDHTDQHKASPKSSFSTSLVPVVGWHESGLSLVGSF